MKTLTLSLLGTFLCCSAYAQDNKNYQHELAVDLSPTFNDNEHFQVRYTLLGDKFNYAVDYVYRSNPQDFENPYFSNLYSPDVYYLTSDSTKRTIRHANYESHDIFGIGISKAIDKKNRFSIGAKLRLGKTRNNKVVYENFMILDKANLAWCASDSNYTNFHYCAAQTGTPVDQTAHLNSNQYLYPDQYNRYIDYLAMGIEVNFALSVPITPKWGINLVYSPRFMYRTKYNSGGDDLSQFELYTEKEDHADLSHWLDVNVTFKFGKKS